MQQIFEFSSLISGVLRKKRGEKQVDKQEQDKKMFTRKKDGKSHRNQDECSESVLYKTIAHKDNHFFSSVRWTKRMVMIRMICRKILASVKCVCVRIKSIYMVESLTEAFFLPLLTISFTRNTCPRWIQLGILWMNSNKFPFFFRCEDIVSILRTPEKQNQKSVSVHQKIVNLHFN